MRRVLHRSHAFRWGTVMLLAALPSTLLATDVSGNQSGTWSLAGSPYYLVGDVTVPAGQTLVIEPGVEVIARGHYSITVAADAVLSAVGTVSEPITFTAEDPVTGWRGLRLVDASDACELRFCKIELARGTGPYPGVRGGAVTLVRCSGTIADCEIRNSSSHNGNFNGVGGGILVEECDALITRNQIYDNSADSGAGICVAEYGTPTILRNVLYGNQATYAGGGIYCGARSSPLIEANVIVENSSRGWGGGGINSWTSYVFYSTYATIRNNLIARNSTTTDGGGLYCRYDRAELYNNTIVANSAARGGGLYVLNQASAEPQVNNTILWGNSAPSGSEIFLEASTSSIVSVSWSTVQGGWSGSGNQAGDPLFVDFAAGDYRLLPGSPCIDAGSNFAIPPDVTSDLDGNPRFVDDPDTKDPGLGTPPVVDHGAYEFQLAACAGDVDGDGDTDFDDLIGLLADYGCPSGCAADLDGDGDTDFSDLVILLGDYGCS